MNDKPKRKPLVGIRKRKKPKPRPASPDEKPTGIGRIVKTKRSKRGESEAAKSETIDIAAVMRQLAPLEHMA